ncbi:hypothetical protein [Novosphingobium sp. FKTRR1]|uniref:hypothetical protein n=1 Tax=Novosphingobium sp. FKTRR1 TaxID=2879118 RepID=UPI001CEFE641|nr:hypothetical protein [Novosphingobium sp. FKTRR1]
MKRISISALSVCLFVLAPFTALAAEVAATRVTVVRADGLAPAISLEWVHARMTDHGVAVTGRLHQGAGRATRAGVPVSVSAGGAKSASVRSSAFAVGGGGATFSVVLPVERPDVTGPVTVTVGAID